MIARFLFAPVLLVLMASASAAPVATPPGWSTYTDAKDGFAMDYPPDWKVNPSWSDKGYGFFQGDHDDVHPGVAFTPTSDLAPGSLLQSDQLVLAIETPRAGAKCEADGFLVDPPPDYFTSRRIDKPELVDTLAQAGDLYTIEHVVIMANKAPCLAVHYVIVSAKGGAKPFDRDALINMLNKITGTLRPAK